MAATVKPRHISILLAGMVLVSVILGGALVASSWVGLRVASRVARSVFMHRLMEIGRNGLMAARHVSGSDIEKIRQAVRDALPESVLALDLISEDGALLFRMNPSDQAPSPDSLRRKHGFDPESPLVTIWTEDTDGTPVLDIVRRLPPGPFGPRGERHRMRGPAGIAPEPPPPLPPGIFCPPGQACAPPAFIRLKVRAEEIPNVKAASRLQLGLAAGVALVLVLLSVLLFVAVTRSQALAIEVQNQAEMARLGEVAAVLSHEIRTPLAAIKGYAQLLAEGLAEGSAARRGAETIERESGRLERLASGLLDLARPVKPAPEHARLGDLVESAAAVIAAKAVAADVRLVLDLPVKPVSIVFDPDLFVQGVLNLLTNAIEASPPKSAVTMSAGASRGRVWCSVADQGPGVKPDEAEDVFKPFHSRKPGGTGLGLAISRRIARSNGGDVTVEPSPTGGTKFTFWVKAEGGGERHG